MGSNGLAKVGGVGGVTLQPFVDAIGKSLGQSVVIWLVDQTEVAQQQW